MALTLAVTMLFLCAPAATASRAKLTELAKAQSTFECTWKICANDMRVRYVGSGSGCRDEAINAHYDFNAKPDRGGSIIVVNPGPCIGKECENGPGYDFWTNSESAYSSCYGFAGYSELSSSVSLPDSAKPAEASGGSAGDGALLESEADASARQYPGMMNPGMMNPGMMNPGMVGGGYPMGGMAGGMDMNMNGIPDHMDPMMGAGMHGGMHGGMPMTGGMDMNMNGIPDHMEHGGMMGGGMMGGGMMGGGMMNPMGGMMGGGMMNRCSPCFMCPMGTHDGGKCKPSVDKCGYNGMFGEMMENFDTRCPGPA